MTTWPLILRNKSENSEVNVPVRRCTESDKFLLKKAAEDIFWTNGASWRLPLELPRGMKAAMTGRYLHLGVRRSPAEALLAGRFRRGRVCHQAASLLVHQVIQPQSASASAPTPRAPARSRPSPGQGMARLAHLERSSAQRQRRPRSSLLRQPRRRRWKSAYSWRRPLPRRNVIQNGSGCGSNGEGALEEARS
ncbi:hypothetical protein DFH94DRAFT_27354 [Russula ochroleuca]|uniref:Uncharacterized protein n=1 Tax=Russula ochroleuca TaxID=152965 RepID=A0A9P5N6E5_9AGAM|nr:hypothetical protein DFH94DRAFT_27354 [Russula ochroleuca]